MITNVKFLSAWLPPSDNEADIVEVAPGLVLLATNLIKCGINASVLNTNTIVKKTTHGFLGTFEQQVNSIADFLEHEPCGTIFGFSTIAPSFHFTLEVIRAIKQRRPDVACVLGGPHASVIPETILAHDMLVDAIFVGPAENAIEQFIKGVYLLKQEQNDSILSCCQNAFYRSGQMIKKGQSIKSKEDFIATLMDFPDYNLVTNEHVYRDAETFWVEGGRGCPFQCTYCSTSKYWEKTRSRPNVQKIVSEITTLQEKAKKKIHIKFSNDLFLSNELDVQCLIEEVKKRHLNFHWTAYARIDQLPLSRLKDLFDIGLRVLYFGIESGSVKIQKSIKKNLNLEKVEDNLKLVRANGIDCIINFMYGFPEENFDDLLDTCIFIAKLVAQGFEKVTAGELRFLTATKIFDDYYTELTPTNKLMNFNNENLGIRIPRRVIKEMQSSPVLFPFAFQHPHIMNSDIYSAMPYFLSFFYYLQQNDHELLLSIIDNRNIFAEFCKNCCYHISVSLPQLKEVSPLYQSFSFDDLYEKMKGNQ